MFDKRAAMAALLALGTACFEYRAATAAPELQGQSVRLELTDAGRVAAAPLAGEGVDRITGLVESIARDTTWLLVTSVRRRGQDETWTRERLGVAQRDVSSVSVKRLSPLRTGLLVAGVALGASIVRVGSGGSVLGGHRTSGGSTSGR